MAHYKRLVKIPLPLALAACSCLTGKADLVLSNPNGDSVSVLDIVNSFDAGHSDEAILLAADAFAFAMGHTLVISRPYVLLNSLTLKSDLRFLGRGALVTLSANVAITASGQITASDTAWIVQGPGTVVFTTAARVSVAWWGASAAASDSAPAFNAAGGSNRTIIVPPSNYTFCSVGPIPATDGAAFDPEAVIYRKLTNLRFTAYGATMTMCPNVSSSPTGSVVFDQITGLVIEGGTYNGTQSGIPPNAENNAIGLLSVSNFVIRDLVCGEGYGGVGSCIGGDWMQNGRVENVRAFAVGIFADVSYLNHVVFDNVHAVGFDGNRSGTTGSAHPGQTGISLKYDLPNASFNLQNMPITDSNEVTVMRSEMTNFATGNLIASGHHIRFIDNNVHDNPGTSDGTAGIGYYIKAGVTSFAPADILIIGGTISSNGTNTLGAGVGITAPSKESDTISGISIVGVRCFNNAPTCMVLDSATNITNLAQANNIFGGPAQLYKMSTAFGQCIANKC